MASSGSESLRLVTDSVREVEDPVLARLDRAARAKEAMLRPMGAAAKELAPSEEKGDYDVEIVRPRAVDVRKLARLAGAAVPADIDATLGGKVPVLLHHGMTPFHRAGRSPQEVWGMGYRVAILGDVADTHSFAPQSRVLKVGEWKQTFEIGLDVGGKLGVPTPATNALSLVPGVQLEGASVRAATDQSFILSLGIELNFLEIQAAPIDAGGARWNLYRQHERLDRFQPLLQTVLVKKGVTSIEVEISTWVRRAGLFGSTLGTREWVQAPRRHVVSLEGLEA